MSGYVYILANLLQGNTYIGVTANLAQRITQHLTSQSFSYTKRYHIHRLVWYEYHDTIESAIAREKQLKGWKKQWKYNLIESVNPNWKTLDPPW